MRWILIAYASGWIFILGATLVAAGALAEVRTSWKNLPLRLAAPGMALSIVCWPPFPLWQMLLSMGLLIGWFASHRYQPRIGPRPMVFFAGLTGLLWACLCLIAFLSQFPSRIAVARGDEITIFGDSITAGEPGMITWPRLLAKEHGLTVHDHSRVGARVADALRRAESLEIPAGVVLLEIGGNDLLGDTPIETFEEDLDRLLRRVSGPGRTVVLFELPLPPLCSRFGEVQSRLARRYNVQCIPRWKFLHVLTAEGATDDSIHLTPKGQQLMANMVGGLLVRDGTPD